MIDTSTRTVQENLTRQLHDSVERLQLQAEKVEFWATALSGFAAPIAPGSVHVDAAAKAAELAVTQGSRGIYNVTETDGTVTSEKASQAFGWDAGWRCGR